MVIGRRLVATLGVGLMAVLACWLGWLLSNQPLGAQTAKPADAGGEVAKLRDELETLKGQAPDQAHAMLDVGYHFSNLWFAGQQANWPLADFYWGETRSHLRWAVRIKPVRQDSAKRDIKLADILQALENTPLKQLKDAIDAKDRNKFVAAYRFTVEGCYACHKASEKPYLHPRIPEHPETAMMNFDPQAEWPK